MAEDTTTLDWKSLYASNLFKWKQRTVGNRTLHYRRLGIVENIFDVDGIDYEGRADLNIHATVEIKTTLTDDALKSRILLAWAYMRHLHPLLSCRSLYGEEFLPGVKGRSWVDKHFVYEKPLDRLQAVNSATKHFACVQDWYPIVDIDDFYVHLMNTARPFDARDTLSTLFVLPIQRTKPGYAKLDTMMVAGHEVADGLTVFRLANSFIDLLNMEEQDLLHGIDVFCSKQGNTDIVMPAAQEALYPVYATTKARDRWNWAITRILRHVRQPPPASFQNPLRRDTPAISANSMPVKYSPVLDYNKTPPLNAFTVKADLSQRATGNLVKLCKQAGISVGSGAFTLVGMVMMRLEELRDPLSHYSKRRPFVGSFPVNPRPFLSGPSTNGKEDSLMLAFSDGITLPFMPSDLDVGKTFRVLGRLAHRQLRQYQKRKRTLAEEVHLGSRSPRELLPALYLSTMERLESKVKSEQRVGFNPQTAYPARQSPTLATCGISSVGDRANLIAAARHDLEGSTRDLAADFRDLRSQVRPRDGEFLVGAIGTAESLQFRVSYDGTNIDPRKAEMWRDAITSIFDFDMSLDAYTNATTSVALSGKSKL